MAVLLFICVDQLAVFEMYLSRRIIWILEYFLAYNDDGSTVFIMVLITNFFILLLNFLWGVVRWVTTLNSAQRQLLFLCLRVSPYGLQGAMYCRSANLHLSHAKMAFILLSCISSPCFYVYVYKFFPDSSVLRLLCGLLKLALDKKIGYKPLYDHFGS